MMQSPNTGVAGETHGNRESKYPQVITPDVLIKIAHVDDEQIRRDIYETEIEIKNLEKDINGYELIANSQRGIPQGRIAAFRTDGKRFGMQKRREFVRFLTAVLEARGSIPAQTGGVDERPRLTRALDGE